MKRGIFGLFALLTGLVVAGPAAVAVERAEITQLARISVMTTFLKTSCKLVPTPEVAKRTEERFTAMAKAQATENDASLDAFRGDLDKAADEFTALNVKLPRAEFCAHLRREFAAAGGALMEME